MAVGLGLDVDCNDVKVLSSACAARLVEQNSGSYDFSAITAKIGTQSRIDAADFTNKVRVKNSKSIT